MLIAIILEIRDFQSIGQMRDYRGRFDTAWGENYILSVGKPSMFYFLFFILHAFIKCV